MIMTVSPPSNTKTTKGNWLPWVIGIAVVLLLAWWLRGCGKTPETGAMADTTQSMMAPDTTPAPAPEAAPAPAPAQTATPAPATPSPTPSEPAQARTPTPSRADTIRAPAAPLPPAESTGPGAMGGRGAPGKKPPATTP